MNGLSSDLKDRHVDPDEIAHMGSFDQQWWDLNGEWRSLHHFNSLRVPWIRDKLIATGSVKDHLIGKPNVLEGLNILDVGCGGGILTEALIKLNGNIVGIDPCEKLIDIAREQSSLSSDKNKVEYRTDTIEEHAALFPNKYDAIVASEVLEHISEKRLFLEAMVKCLKPGGSLFITTFNRGLISYIIVIIFGEYLSGLVPIGTHSWFKFIAPQNTAKILSEYNCHTASVRGCWYTFWSKNWSWNWTNKISYALHAVKSKN
jgi:polyprenyldihydroxybenzoate methyltransferase/3-demethylubiquinol 3-O-methyltransferase